MATLLNPFIRAMDANGDPVSGGKLAVFLAGTSTAVTTYSDRALTSAQAQPLIANSAGEFAQSFVAPGIYKIRVRDADDNTLYENDNVRIADRPDDPTPFDDEAAVLADTATYTTGAYIRTTLEGFTFEAAASGATDHDETNAGGQKLYRKWQPYDTPTALLASEESVRGEDAQWLTRDGHNYKEAASGASDHHVTTAGGVKLYVVPEADGYNALAFGVVADGTTDDTDAIIAGDAAAGAAGANLLFPAGVYSVAGRSAAIAPTTTWVGESTWYNQFALPEYFAMPDVGTVIDGGSANLDILAANFTARELRGINFRGTGTGACIHLTSGSRLSRVANCAFHGKENAIKLSGTVAYLLRFERIFAAKQTSHGVHLDWGTGAFNDISIRDSWILRSAGNGVNATGAGGGCTIFEIASNSITDGTGNNAAIIINGVQGCRIIGNDIEGWGATYTDPDTLTGKTGYQANAIAMQLTGGAFTIEGNVTYGGGNSLPPIRLLTARQVRFGPNRLLKDLSTYPYAITVDTTSQDVVIDPQTVDYSVAALVATPATRVINNASGNPDFQVPLLASQNVVFPDPETVASGTSITIPDEPVVKISGTTSITFITGKPYQMVTLEFLDVLVVVDSPPGVGNLRLDGDFTTAAGSTLTLMSRGASASWVEVSRSANA